MAVCSHCNGETPEGNPFCVNCGGKMPVTTGAQSTQFGMPLLRPTPASERGGGPATTQFGAEELSALALAAQEAGLDPEPEPLKPSLMSGLPRPPVSSAPSPLTASTGLKAPISPRPMPSVLKVPLQPGQTSPQTPAARRTVMGMPLLGSSASAPPMAVVPEPIGILVAPQPETAGVSAILSMDSLVNDLLNPTPVAAAIVTAQPSVPIKAAVAPGPAGAAAAATAPIAAIETTRPGATRPESNRDPAVTPTTGEPSVRVSRVPLDAQNTEPTDANPATENTLPKTSLVPVVVGVVLVIALGVAIFILKG